MASIQRERASDCLGAFVAAVGLYLLASVGCPFVATAQGASTVDRASAIADAGYHRYLCFGAADDALRREMQRELLPHERQAVLPWPQRATIERVERAMRDRAGEVITARWARQTGKNETEAQIESRLLTIFRGIPGARWIRMAPTYQPQLINSKARLDKFLACDPLIAGRFRKREGGRVEVGHATVQFLSAQVHANVVGATASIGLSLDEAHRIDAGKFESDLAPFTASTNAPVVMWGVAADKQDLLYEYVERNRGTDRNLEFPAAIWCELSPVYAAHYAGRVAKLGKDHPWIRTQYDLIDIEALGAYLNDAQRRALFAGEHPRLANPRPGLAYGIAIDIGGESEKDLPDEELRAEEPGRDYLMAWVFEWDPAGASDPYPEVRIVEGHWWTGREHMAVAPDLVATCRHWNVRGGCIDARGVGEAVAGAVHRAFPCVEAYKATSESVSQDCFDLLARINTGKVRFWKGDPARDDELREMLGQSRHTRYQIAGHQLMKLVKPSGSGSTGAHIDGIKALTYLHRALAPREGSGVADYYAQQARAQRGPA